MKLKGYLSLLVCSLFFIFFSVYATGQTLRYKAVWYRPTHQAFVAELADDTPSSPFGGSPREAVIASVDQNFMQISQTLRANAVVINLNDDDTYAAAWGGGWSYDPCNRPKPQNAVAQEIILSLANKWGLKVIFEVNFSNWHRYNNDAFGTGDPTMQCPRTPGAYDYIHHLIDPVVFYAQTPCSDSMCQSSPPSHPLCTTKLSSLAGLSDHCTRTYFDDPRVAGWQFSGEWCVDPSCFYVSQDTAFINKYWGHFYNLVHWCDDPSHMCTSAGQFAGIYPQSSPDDTGGVAAAKNRIFALKQMFAPGPGGLTQPDVFGFAWYGTGNYNLQSISGDIRTLRDCMEGIAGSGCGYSVLGNSVLLMEGGSNKVSDSYFGQFFTDAINTAAEADSRGSPLAGISVWVSDGFGNLDASCSDTSSGAQSDPDGYSIFNYTFTWAGCRLFPWPSGFPGWHFGSDAVFTHYQATYGRVNFPSLRSVIGPAIRDAFAAH